MGAGVNSEPRRFDANDPNRRVVQKRMEKPDGVGATADAGDEGIGKPPLQ